MLRAGEEAARCPPLGAVIIEPWGAPKALDLVASRRLALAAALSSLGAGAASAATPAASPTQPGARPNILVIMGDDIGYWNVGAYSHGVMVPTPHIDRIAREGMLFTDHYAQPSCTAGRAAFVTGERAPAAGDGTFAFVVDAKADRAGSGNDDQACFAECRAVKCDLGIGGDVRFPYARASDEALTDAFAYVVSADAGEAERCRDNISA